MIVTYASLSSSVGGAAIHSYSLNDKLMHFTGYAILSILLASMLGVSSPGKWTFWKIVLLSSLYGLLMEILQMICNTGRLFEYFDIVANIFGAFAGTMLIYVFYRSNKKENPKPN